MFLGRVVGPEEPLWLDDDTEAVLAFLDYEKALCSGCGHSRLESFNRRYSFAYEAEVVRCHSCKAKAHKEKELSNDSGFDTSGAYVYTTLNEQAVVED